MNPTRYYYDIERLQTPLPNKNLPFQTSVSPAVITPLGTWSLIPAQLPMLKALLEVLSGDFLQSQVLSQAHNPGSLFSDHRSFITQSNPSQLHFPSLFIRPSSI